MLVSQSKKLVGKIENPKFPEYGPWVQAKDLPEKVLIETKEFMTGKDYGTPGIRIGSRVFLFGVPSPNGVVDVTKSTTEFRVLISGTTVVLTQE